MTTFCWFYLIPRHAAVCLHSANDHCHARKRSTIAATDVLSAVDESDFAAFLPLLRRALECKPPAATRNPSPFTHGFVFAGYHKKVESDGEKKTHPVLPFAAARHRSDSQSSGMHAGRRGSGSLR